MRRRLLCAVMTAFVTVACSSSDDSSGSPSDASVSGERADICSTFTKAGEPCAAAEPDRCFPLCATGGCFCSGSAAGPVWKCVLDTSCFPDGSPLDDTGTEPIDSGAPDAGDVSDAGDASETGD